MVIEAEARRALSRSGMPENDYALNPYLGCQHACAYCYAMDMTRFPDGAAWGDFVIVRKNIVSLLEAEIKGKRRGIVALGTITDPYQAVEAKFRLSRGCEEVLLRNGFYTTIQTKSPLVLRDLDLLKAHRDMVDVGLTITTLDMEAALRVERKTPSPEARARALRELARNGIRTWIFYGPIIRGYNDSREEAERIIGLAAETNSEIFFDRYNRHRLSDMEMSRVFGGLSVEPGGKWYSEISSWIVERCRREGVRVRVQWKESRHTLRSTSLDDFSGQ